MPQAGLSKPLISEVAVPEEAPTAKRAGKSGLLTASSIPFDEAEWSQLGYRARLKAYADRGPDGNPYPILGHLTYLVRVPLWYLAFWTVFRDPTQGLADDLNVKRFIVYNVLFDCLGLGAQSGPLGQRFKLRWPCDTWWYFLTPGTLTYPLLPVKALRTWYTVVLFVGYIAALLRTLLAPSIGAGEVVPAVVLLAVLTLFDYTPFFASRGEHYGYQLVCLAFAGPQWRFGCQMVQWAVWTYTGTAKMGPWFPYCVSFMMPQILWLRNHVPAVRRVFERDGRATRTCRWVASVSSVYEASLGWLCLPLATRAVGMWCAVSLHASIILMTPIAAVFEWNIYGILMAVFLFNNDEPLMPLSEISPVLLSFLAIVLLLLPIVGQFFPTLFPYLLSYRVYAGNWQWGWWAVKKDAVPKLKRLKTFHGTPMVGEQAVDFMREPRYEEHLDYFLTNKMCHFPVYRMVPSVAEWLMKKCGWTADEFHGMIHLPFENFVVGYGCGGWGTYRESFRAAVQEVCNFGPEEFFCLQIESLGLCQRNVAWRLVDISDGRVVLKGSSPFDEMEKLSDPTSFQAEMLEPKQR